MEFPSFDASSRKVPKPAAQQPLQSSKRTGKAKKSYGILTQHDNKISAPSFPSSDDEDNDGKQYNKATIPFQPSLTHIETFKHTLLPPFLAAGIQLVAHLTTLFPLYTLHFLHAPYFAHFLTLGILIHAALVPLSGYISLHAHTAYPSHHHQQYYSSSAKHYLLQHKQNTILTACMLPALGFAVLSVVNVSVLWQVGATAVPFSRIVGGCVVWAAVQSVLVGLGTWVAGSELAESGGGGLYIHQFLPLPISSPSDGIYDGQKQHILDKSSTIPRSRAAKTLLLYTLASLAPFLTAWLATDLLSLACFCSLSQTSLRATLLTLKFNGTLTCSGAYPAFRTAQGWSTVTSTPAGLYILTLASLLVTATVVGGTPIVTPFFALGFPRRGQAGSRESGPNISNTNTYGDINAILIPFTLASSPSVPLFFSLFYTFLANPLRPRGVVSAVLYAVYVALGCVGVALVGGVVGVVGVCLLGRGNGGMERVEIGGREGKSE